jgi:hypothetical protein
VSGGNEISKLAPGCRRSTPGPLGAGGRPFPSSWGHGCGGLQTPEVESRSQLRSSAEQVALFGKTVHQPGETNRILNVKELRPSVVSHRCWGLWWPKLESL